MKESLSKGPKEYIPEKPVILTKGGQEELDIKIEIAQPSDWEAYKEIRLEALKNSPEAFGSLPERFEKESKKSKLAWQDPLLDQMKFMVLVKKGENPQGIALATKKRNKKGNEWWIISEVYLTPKLRGTGIARKILEKIINEIKNRGGKKVTLNVNKAETQRSAFELYKKLGFRPIKRINESFQSFYKMVLDL